MKLYILEDDPTVIAVLEQIIESNDLGTVCGDSADDMPSIEQIMQAGPDIILMDFLMPHRDGVATLRQLRAAGCKARCIMISQVSDKDMIAQAYSAGVDFFISKPINVIEVCTVISNATTQLENERKLTDIGRLFGLQGLDAAAISAGSKAAVREDQPPETSPRLHSEHSASAGYGRRKGHRGYFEDLRLSFAKPAHLVGGFHRQSVLSAQRFPQNHGAACAPRHSGGHEQSGTPWLRGFYERYLCALFQHAVFV